VVFLTNESGSVVEDAFMGAVFVVDTDEKNLVTNDK
jgi:hypothetical protein